MIEATQVVLGIYGVFIRYLRQNKDLFPPEEYEVIEKLKSQRAEIANKAHDFIAAHNEFVDRWKPGPVNLRSIANEIAKDSSIEAASTPEEVATALGNIVPKLWNSRMWDTGFEKLAGRIVQAKKDHKGPSLKKARQEEVRKAVREIVPKFWENKSPKGTLSLPYYLLGSYYVKLAGDIASGDETEAEKERKIKARFDVMSELEDIARAKDVDKFTEWFDKLDVNLKEFLNEESENAGFGKITDAREDQKRVLLAEYSDRVNEGVELAQKHYNLCYTVREYAAFLNSVITTLEPRTFAQRQPSGISGGELKLIMQYLAGDAVDAAWQVGGSSDPPKPPPASS